MMVIPMESQSNHGKRCKDLKITQQGLLECNSPFMEKYAFFPIRILQVYFSIRNGVVCDLLILTG